MKADMHIHTNNSHDARSPIDDVCRVAIERGLSVINISDHCDIGWGYRCDHRAITQRSVCDALAVRERYAGRLKIMAGVEISEGHWFPELTEQVLDLDCFDSVTGSTHIVHMHDGPHGMAGYDFTKPTMEQIYATLSEYYDDILRVLKFLHPNILAHCTYPLRYINKKYGRGVDIMHCMERYEEIFAYIMKNDIALETNTAYMDETGLPDEDIAVLTRYFEMGGKLLTIGSDAHHCDRVAGVFDIVTAQLKDIGFREGVYFEKRQPVAYTL